MSGRFHCHKCPTSTAPPFYATPIKIKCPTHSHIPIIFNLTLYVCSEVFTKWTLMCQPMLVLSRQTTPWRYVLNTLILTFFILALQKTNLRLRQLTFLHTSMNKLTMLSESATTRRLMVPVSTVYLLLICTVHSIKRRQNVLKINFQCCSTTIQEMFIKCALKVYFLPNSN